ncbi:MAG: adenylate/guanylate cyclase domain-containing protein [Leptospiraceae bacterium]|nr:adenylate/guanylate cyclase domain-containing protein [Leptospiraceae bacterium]
MKEQDKTVFIPSRWTIKLKLIFINSSTIFLALSAMIVIATIFFKEDSETRVKENGLHITDIVGSHIRNQFLFIAEKINLMQTTLQQEFKNESQKENFISLFFQNDKNFIMLSKYKLEKDKLVLEKMVFNSEAMEENRIKENDFLKVISTHEAIFKKAIEGKAVLKNVSPILKIPVFAIAIPFDKNKKTLSLAILHVAAINKAFENKGAIGVNYLVNEEGEIIAHPIEAFILSAKNLYSSPVVKQSLSETKGTYETGQIRYLDTEQTGYFIGSYNKTGFASSVVVSDISENKAFEEVYNIQRRNIFIMVITLGVAFSIIYNFANNLIKPLLALVKATKRIQKGEFEISLTPTTRDELGLLTNSFTEMGKGLSEREKVKDALTRFVNREVAEMALHGEIKLGGERKNCVIFFSDIRSFTAISEKMEPEAVIEFLNEYMTAMVSCINETGGTVDKYIGDAIMATWGVPISKGNDVENALTGTLMMRKALIKFNRGRGSEDKPIIRIGCGLNYGPVVAGQMGSSEKLQYTVIGDAVNLASRVEPLNKPFGTDILITEDLYNIVKDIYRVEKMSSIKVKGKSEPQSVYALLGRFDDPSDPKTIDELRELVGIQYDKKKAENVNVEAEEVKYEILE